MELVRDDLIFALDDEDDWDSRCDRMGCEECADFKFVDKGRVWTLDAITYAYACVPGTGGTVDHAAII